jgi:MoxR-like ATPase
MILKKLRQWWLNMEINEKNIQEFSTRFLEIEKAISEVIIGQKDIIKKVLMAIIAGGNVLLEGLPGLGKTQLVKTIGKVMDLQFSRIQFTPDLMPADVVGTNIIVKKPDGTNEFQFQPGPVFSNIVLADEINRATPKTQSAMLEAMQEKTVTVGNNTYYLPSPFFVLATQNPLEMEGTYPLPEAQMDRFMFKLDVKFPTQEELAEIVRLTTGKEAPEARQVCDKNTLIEMGVIAKEVPVATAVYEYAMSVVLKLHPESENAPEATKKYIHYGPSPRGAQAIITAAKINALIDGRYNVSFDDIKEVALPTLRHRIFLNFEALSDKVTADDLILEVLKDGK